MDILIIIYSLFKLCLIITIYQQAHYYIKDYIRYFINNFIAINIIPIIGIVLLYTIDIKIIGMLILFLYSFSYLRIKKIFKLTKRIIILSIFIFLYYLTYLIPYVNYILIVFIEIFIIPILLIDKLINYIINKKYINLCIDKLNKYNGIKIGITGSYGKTTLKCLLNDVLNIYYNSSKTPKSYNTMLGISKYINNNIIDIYDYLILEMGISKKNDMDKLCKIIKLDVSIITDIGYMHLNDLKGLDGVYNEKIKICNDSKILILNYDCKYLKEYKSDKVIISYGLNNGDNRAININNGEFDYYYKGKFITHFKTNLLCKEQILDLLACIAYLYYLKMDINLINRISNNFKLENNRLQIKEYDKHVIIDDSYNSNVVGFKAALKILKDYDKDIKILITPGICEINGYEDIIYDEIKLDMIASCNLIIVVGNSEVDVLYKKLSNYLVSVIRVRSFNEGYYLYKRIIKMYTSSALLIENDLPDIYIRRRIM